MTGKRRVWITDKLGETGEYFLGKQPAPRYRFSEETDQREGKPVADVKRGAKGKKKPRTDVFGRGSVGETTDPT